MRSANWPTQSAVDKHGLTTYYNVNRHFNHTNICVADCKFCGFYKRARQEGAYTHSVEEGIEIARSAVDEGATELHIVGGLNSKLPFEYYTDLFSSLKREFPKLHLKALTMVELDFFARFYKMSDEDVIEQTARGRNGFVSGRRRRDLCRADAFAHLRSQVRCRPMARARRQGPQGRPQNKRHDALRPHRIDRGPRRSFCAASREQQDKTGGFQCFIPLAFYPPGTALSNLPGPDAIDNLKTIAVSRLMLDNFDHIKAYWVMLGKATAQTALHFGANDLDGTITDGGELTHSYSVESGGEVKMTKQEIIEMIERAGFEAVERDTVYNRVEYTAA